MPLRAWFSHRTKHEEHNRQDRALAHIAHIAPRALAHRATRALAHTAARRSPQAWLKIPREMLYMVVLVTSVEQMRRQEAINQFNGCILANETYPGVRDAQAEAVGRMRELQRPRRGGW